MIGNVILKECILFQNIFNMLIFKSLINNKLYTLYDCNIGLGSVIKAEPYGHYTPPPKCIKGWAGGVNKEDYVIVGKR